MPPALRALLLTVAATGVAGLVARTAGLPAWAAVGLIGALAGAGAALLRMDRWWPPLLLALPPAVWLAQRLPVPAWVWGAFGLGLLALYGSVFRSQVPLFLSRRDVWQVVLALLPPPAPGRRFRFVDLGSGFGGLPRFIARHRPDVDCTGVELAPLPAQIAAWRARLRPVANARLTREDLWTLPLDGIDVAFAFLSPVPMAALWRKARQEMPAGALLVSCEFEIPDVTPETTISGPHRRLFLYRIN